MVFLAPLLLGDKNKWLQWAGIAVGFVGVIIFIGADQRATEAALWVYLLPMLATASLTCITLSERRRAGRPACTMPVFTALFWQGLLTAILLLPLAIFDEEFVATINGELIFAVIWLGIIVSVLALDRCFD